jgi:hypothetical protein
LRGAAFSREELAAWRAVAIHAFVRQPQWTASFLAVTAGGALTPPPRHCEARSAVAIHAFIQRPQCIASFLAMTAGVRRHPTPSLRGTAFSREELATWRAVAIHAFTRQPQ